MSAAIAVAEHIENGAHVDVIHLLAGSRSSHTMTQRLRRASALRPSASGPSLITSTATTDGPEV